jgi:uncharacterized protein (DUF2147 family)
MRTVMTAGIMSVLFCGGALAASEAPNGTWLTEDGSSKVRIAPCGATYCATIVWVKPAAPGEADPHPTLAGKDMVGTHLSRTLRRAENGELAGPLLNPENGKTYDVTVKLKNANALEMGGCILGGLLCGSETWTRASEDVAYNPQKPAAPPARPAGR